MNAATTIKMLRYTGKKHTSLSNQQIEVLNYLGAQPMLATKLQASWNTHHRLDTSDITFMKILLSLLEEGYIATCEVTLQPTPRQYQGVLTVNPDGTASFITNPLQYGPRVTIILSGVNPTATTIKCKVMAQA